MSTPAFKSITKNTVGWGLIGASNIAQFQVVPAIRQLPGHQVVAVASGNAEHAKKYAADVGIPHHFGGKDAVAALLARADIDAVYISSTNELHREQVLAAAAAGKHVLCEKPLAMSVNHALEMARACEAAGVVMATNHHLRNAATHRKIRELLSSGAIGKPLFARVFHAVYLPPVLQGWRINNPAAGGGVILDIAVHDIDTLRFSLGLEPLEVVAMSQSATLATAGLEDGAMSVVRFEGGLLAHMHEAFTVKHAGTGIEYHGENGSIVGRHVMTQRPIGEVILRNAEGEKSFALEHENLYVRGLTAFARAMAGRGSAAATAMDGVRSLAGAIAVANAAATGQKQTVQVVA